MTEIKISDEFVEKADNAIREQGDGFFDTTRFTISYTLANYPGLLLLDEGDREWLAHHLQEDQYQCKQEGTTQNRNLVSILAKLKKATP